MAVKFSKRDEQLSISQLKRNELYASRFPDIAGEKWKEFLASLKENGQQDTIAVAKNGDGYDVVDGYQRWRGAGDLGWSTIKADILAGSWQMLDEKAQLAFIDSRNKHRRHLTFSEKTGGYEKATKRKAGRRKRIAAESAAIKNSANPEENSDSAQDVAKSFGYSSPRTARADVALAKATIPAVHQAIEEKTITKEEAKQIAKVPKLEQEDALGRAIAGQPIIPPKPEPPKLTTTEEKMKEGNSTIESWCRSIEKVFKESQPENPWLGNDEIAIAESQIKSCISTLRAAKGYGECPKCDGKGCKFCRKSGWMPRSHYESNGGRKK